MKKLCAMMVALLALLALGSSLFAMEVAEGTITTNIVDRVPVDNVESYAASVGKLFCFTRITGAEGEAMVAHVWYRNGEEMGRIELPVRSANWRTYSSKNILPEWTGDWKVDVVDGEGNVLKSMAFVLN